MVKIETEIAIAAPADKVWQVLTDFSAYPEWNPFIRQLSGELKMGGLLRMQTLFFGGKLMNFRSRVTHLETNRELRWLGHFLLPWVFDGEHGFRLEALSPEQTRLLHFEVFSGLLVPLFARRLGEKTRHGFAMMNLAMQTRAQSVASSRSEARGER